MRRERRGAVLILALALVAVLAMVATAFIITARLESRAATNGLRGVQAEASCRSGLAAAIGRAQRLYNLGTAVAVYSTDSWHDYFYDASGPDLCTDPKTGTEWVEHYDPITPKYEMKAKRWPMPRLAGSDPARGDVKRLKRTRGFAAEYYVAVADLDSKLHCNPSYFDNQLNMAQTKSMLGELGLASVNVRDALAEDDKPNWSLGQLRKKLIDKVVPEAEYKLNETEKFFTVYPRVAVLDKANMGRPPVNVNTARKKVLLAIFVNIPNLAGNHAENLADYLISKRPIANRAALETVIYDVSPAGTSDLPDGGGKLSEEEFNNILNSLNYKEPSIYANDGDVPTKKTGTSGVYEIKFKVSDGSYEAQLGGQKTSADASATWGTEVKFVSRFYHVYVLGRTVADDAARRVMSERRLHAVYDALTRRVLWMRWNHEAKANMGD